MSTQRTKVSSVATIFAVGVVGLGSAQANLIVNGDFEDNTASDSFFSLSNDQFNFLMNSVTAYGVREGIDLMTFGAGYGQDPQSGSWKVTPAADAGGDTEEFSFDLTGPVNAGTSYDLSFYIEGLMSGGFDGGRAEIGLSSSPTSFGTLVHTSADATLGWSLESTTFIAPIDAAYLTVRVATSEDHWIGLDNFSLTVAPDPCEGDANGDGLVDPLDSGFVLARFGCAVGTGDPNCDAADMNGDGLVDPLDSGFVLARFGECP